MGILTGALLAGLIAKFVGWRKKNNVKPDEILKLYQAKKIAVIGCAGSGKTYFSQKLADILQLPLIHLDQYAWKPNWEKVNFDELTYQHQKLCKQDEWIIEGIYFKLLDQRIQAADVVIFLDISRWQCLWNVIKRAIVYSNQVIPGNPQGCKQRLFSWKFLEFLRWIWNFNKKHRSNINQLLELYKDGKQIYVIRSMQEMNDFIQTFYEVC